ncbi:MAG: NBR1-Ig-like domain-containing protein [Armatimonadota bacterium]|nr:NBR1-Ig-like domain-containing protein [Armatimonadota bacterium]
MKVKLWVSAALALVLLATAATAQVQILSDPLQTSTNGTQVGGSFTGSAYRIDAKQDAIYWHLPHVVRNGYAEVTVTGMDALPGGWAKYEIFHSYDADLESADTNAAGYDNAIYKMYFRKESADKIRTCAVLVGVFNDTTSTINPGWAGTHTLKFQWASVTGSLTITTYWDGVFQETKTVNNPGQIWNPSTMSVRIGASSRGGTTGAVTGATYSNFQVVDLDMTPQPDDAQAISNNLPTGLTVGQLYAATITMKNIGSATWTAAGGYQLGAVDDSDPFCAFTRVDLDGGDSIAPNQEKVFNFILTAPSTTGMYTTDWRMIHNGSWFGPTVTKQVQVTWPETAQYISDTIPATMTAGQQYNVSVTMRNTSQNIWTQAGEYKLGAVGNYDPFGPGRIELSPSDSIGQNQQKTFTFTMTAPTTGGTYATDWQMVHELVTWFGDILAKQVEVEQAQGEVGLVLSDPLCNSSTGTRSGGAFVTSPVCGWQVTGDFDYIYWHLPYTVAKGAVEFSVIGLSDATPTSKDEIIHMYDASWNNADTQYGGYRDNPYKHFVRKIGAQGGATNAHEIVWKIINNEIEADSVAIPYNVNNNYRFREEWIPDATGLTTFKLYRDGALVWTDNFFGFYQPNLQSVRIAASNRGEPMEGAPNGATYSNLKVYDLSETVIPGAPTVIQPGNTQTITTTAPVIKWQGEFHSAYQIRVNTTNDPNLGVVWDSGQVPSHAFEANCPALANLTTYYVFIKLGTATGWSSWSPAGYWFSVDTSYVRPRRGLVRVVGNGFEDDGGKFLGLGFTHMRGLNRFKYDRARYQDDMSDMGSKGFNYQRILSMVSWPGLEIVPITAQNGYGQAVYAWADYDQVFTGAIDTAYDNYGLRTEVTIFADAQWCMPNSADRYAHMDRILSLIAGREHKIQYIEVCNEYFQNGLSQDEVRTFGCYLAARTSIPVTLSAPGDLYGMYQNSCADISSIHTSRDTGYCGWEHVFYTWQYKPIYPIIPPVVDNEPIGDQSSVAEELDPTRLCSSAAFDYIAGLAGYVYHGRFGTSGIDKYDGHDVHMSATQGFSAYKAMIELMPPNAPNWTRNDGLEAAAPFTVFYNGTPNAYGPGCGSGTGCIRNIGAANPADPDEWVCLPMGVQTGGVVLQARRTLSFSVYNVLTGALLAGYPVTKNTGENITLPGTATAYLVKSVADDFYPPAPPPNFAATPNGTTNNLSWTNPTDLDFAGTMVRFRIDTYPSGPADGTLVCNRTALPGSNDSFAHNGVNPGQCYFYAAYAYDEVPNYSMAATAPTCPVTLVWLNEIFDNYNNGNLGGQGDWVTVGAASAQVQSAVAKGGTGKAALMDPFPTGQSIANMIQFTDKTTGYDYLSFDILQDAAGTLGQIVGYVSVYGSDSATEITKLHVQRGRMFVEYGSGTLATLSAAVVNQTWYNVRFGFNVDTRKFDLWLDGAAKGTNYAWKGTATKISKIVIMSDRNVALNPQKIYLDNVKLEPKLTISAVTDDGSWM